MRRLFSAPVIACVWAVVLSAPWCVSEEAGAKHGSPADSLPAHIQQLTHFGERADFSPDGKRIVFLEKTFGDAYELNLETKVLRPITSHFYHEGFVRVLYLSNGDYLLSGAKEFDAGDPLVSRTHTPELWILDKSLTKPPTPLGELCAEGPAVSRKHLKIAWTRHHPQDPDSVPEGESQMWMADVVYENGTPSLQNHKMILDTRNLEFDCALETQNFRPPLEEELIFSSYGYQGGEVMGVVIATGEVTNYSQGPDDYEEPEGIFPDGAYTCVERVVATTDPFKDHPPLDIWKLKLDGSRQFERLTYFSDYPGYRASNPVVSDDGRYMAFQMAKTGEQAGVGHGIFLYDFHK